MMHPRLTARQIAIRLDPHSSNDLPPAILHTLSYLSEQIWIQSLHPLVILGRALCIGEIWFCIHHVKNGSKRNLTHLDRLHPPPQPCRVDVRVTIENEGEFLCERINRCQRSTALREA